MAARDRRIIGYPLRVLAALGGRHWLRQIEPTRSAPYLAPALDTAAPLLRADADLPPRLAAVRNHLAATMAVPSAARVVADELLRNAAAEAHRRYRAGYER